MEKINRLGWTAGFSFTSYGVRVGVRVNELQVSESLLKHLPPDWKPAASPIVDRLYSLIIGSNARLPNIRRYNLLYEDHVQIARALDYEQVCEKFESSLRLAIAEAAPRRVFIHAGVVGWHGRAIIIPGRSFSGKTTLISELVRAGATYYSDEYAVLDSQGRVHPYAKPLSIRENGEMKQRDLTVEELGGVAGIKPLRVELVLMSHYRTGARWRPKSLSAGQGALALLDNAIAARRQTERVMSAIQQVVAHARVLKGVRGEAREVTETILDQLDSKSLRWGPRSPR